ncbi:hypothetical protein ACJMK2_031717 [Sinanodonta woodiana]|uniref:Sushi domain-containing protein n=1 Tax=Sinanodonta woodiana TaxID=1069815 RepID=A0ABD3WZN3_SINWO
MYTFYWISLILLTEFSLSEDACERDTCLGQLNFGMYLPRAAFTTKYQISPYQCAVECQCRRQRCKSFNYKRSALSCQLCEEDSGPEGINLQPKAGLIHSNIDTWKNIPIGNCNAITCSWTERCDSSVDDPQKACIKTECQFAVLQPGVRIEPSNETAVRTKARYRCMSDDMERGQFLTTCLESTAEWSKTDFKCVCKSPPAKSWTILEEVEVEVGQNYTYRCQNGLVGKHFLSPTVTCLQDGSWTLTNFTCVCNYPPAKSGTILEEVEVDVGQNYTYRCQNGLVGKTVLSPTVTCLQNGSWTLTNFTCVCKSPPAKSLTILEAVEVEVGHNYSYRCQNGLVGKTVLSPTVTCLHDGSWTLTNFTCVCETPPMKSGAIHEMIEVEVQQTYTYKCYDGIFGKRDHNPTITCLQDGNWTSTNFFLCKTPPEKLWTINVTAEVEVGQTYTYTCKDGVFGKGQHNPTITCLRDGSWTSTHFICVKQNWTEEIIYPFNIHKSVIIGAENETDLLACMQTCDNHPNCLSFFYYNNTNECVLSSSFRRGLPDGFLSAHGLVYYIGNIGNSTLCIKLHEYGTQFNESMTICESEKAKVLVVTTSDEIDDLKTFIEQNGGGKYIEKKKTCFIIKTHLSDKRKLMTKYRMIETL